MKNELKVLDWDTKYFGNKIASLQIASLEPHSLYALLDKAEANGVECVYCLVPVSEKNKIEFVENVGFHLVDIRMTFSLDLRDYTSRASSDVITATQKDSEELIHIAKTAFTVSRFINDPHINPEKAKAFYVEWLHKNLKSEYPIFIAKQNDKIAGFISTERNANTGKIGLVALGENARGQGMGRQLVEKAAEYFKDSGCDTCTVVTQGENISAVRLYERTGFSISTIELWYHKWFKQKGLMAA